MKEVTDQELLRHEAQDNTMWQDLVDAYQTEPKQCEMECRAVIMLMRDLSMPFAGMALIATMARLHTTIGHQTGKMYTFQDIQD